jgi:uncharacterized damage-inducible protein DinB
MAKTKARAKTSKKRASAAGKTRKPARKAAARKARAPEFSPKKQFLDTFTREHATTLKVLRALPPEQSEFRPHPRSNSARDLAFTFVMEQELIKKALTDTLVLGSGMPKAPDDFRAIVAQFENDHRSLVDLIKRLPDSKFDETVKFPTGPGQMGDWPKMAFAWFLLSDQIHHRGQLSVYVRMAGGKVPSIYGPSADETWR